MFPMNRKTPPVTVEYDKQGQRATKTFDCPFTARRFFTAKAKAGKRPRVVAAT